MKIKFVKECKGGRVKAGAEWGQSSLQSKVNTSKLSVKISKLHQHNVPLIPHTKKSPIRFYTNKGIT
jgi:hypothetical protein